MSRRRYQTGHEIMVCCAILGVELEVVFKKAGIACEPDRVKQLTLTAKQCAAAFYALITEYGKEDFYLKLAEGFSSVPYGATMYSFAASANIEEGLQRLAKIKATIQPVNWDLRLTKKNCQLHIFELDPFFPINGLSGILSFLWIILIGRNYSLQNIKPQRVILSSPIPLHEQAEEKIGCKIEIGSENILELDKATSKLPLLTDGGFMGFAYDKEAERRLDTTLGESQFSERAAQHISRLLPSGQITAARIAQNLTMSQRTFERRLREEGTNFTKLLNEIRYDLSIQYLSSDTMSVAEIGFMLGFEEPNSFIRAFKRWHGLSPNQFRKRHKDKVVRLEEEACSIYGT
ncbi:AraC family transcriptional regulator [Cohaesibacter gelatinilyticus]|nr:AraC family transcriptional regulator [Cohaesibacter gelatinilyticus]